MHQVLSLAYLIITGDCCIYNYMQWDILIMKACESVSQKYKHHTDTINCRKTKDRFREVYNGSWLGAEPFIEEAIWNTEQCASST